jgi:hypothetical protein
MSRQRVLPLEAATDPMNIENNVLRPSQDHRFRYSWSANTPIEKNYFVSRIELAE